MEEIISGCKFRAPAPETSEFMKEQAKFNQHFELNMNDMKNSIKVICEKLDTNKEEHREIMHKIDQFITTADTRYAEKKIESIIAKVLWAFGFLIVGAISAAVFKLIFK